MLIKKKCKTQLSKVLCLEFSHEKLTCQSVKKGFCSSRAAEQLRENNTFAKEELLNKEQEKCNKRKILGSYNIVC